VRIVNKVDSRDANLKQTQRLQVTLCLRSLLLPPLTPPDPGRLSPATCAV
jgi:hypothetical protein